MWGKQPPQFLSPGRYELDHSQPLARGLELALFGSHLPGGGRWVDLSQRGNHGTLVGGLTWGVTATGAGVLDSGSHTKYALLRSVNDPADPRPITILFAYRANSVAVQHHAIINNNDSTGPRLYLGVEQLSGATYRLGLYSGGFIYGDSFTLTTNLTHYATTWAADNSAAFYRNGTATGTGTLAVGGFADPGARLGGLKETVSTFSMIGVLAYFVAYSRILSAAEIASFHRNPYQLLRLEPRWWPGVTAAATAPDTGRLFVPAFVGGFR